LAHVEVRHRYDALAERFGKQLTGRAREWVLGTAPAGVRPRHNFHAFDIHRRVGELGQTLETMDPGPISAGQLCLSVGTPRRQHGRCRHSEALCVGSR
jgi:hypothetical protein